MKGANYEKAIKADRLIFHSMSLLTSLVPSMCTGQSWTILSLLRIRRLYSHDSD